MWLVKNAGEFKVVSDDVVTSPFTKCEPLVHLKGYLFLKNLPIIYRELDEVQEHYDRMIKRYEAKSKKVSNGRVRAEARKTLRRYRAEHARFTKETKRFITGSEQD